MPSLHVGVRDIAERVAEVEVRRALARPDVQVHVRDLVALHEQPDPLGSELLVLGAADLARDLEEVRGDVGLQVDPVVTSARGTTIACPAAAVRS